MAFKRWGETRQDTGWGLIFRLNDIMRKVELATENGDLDKWNLLIDRIYANILYKNPMDVLKDKKDEPTSITFSPDDIKEFSHFNKLIAMLRKQMREAKENENINQLKPLHDKLYSTIFKKDIWIRKKMFKLNLYLREVDNNPMKAIYG